MKMKVFFATNRGLKVENGVVQELKKPYELDTEESESGGLWRVTCPDAFQVGTAKVFIEEGTEIVGEPLDDEAVYKSECVDLAEEIYEGTRCGSGQIFQELIEAVRNNGDTSKNIRYSVMVFVHGFNNSLAESITTGAELAHLYSSKEHRLIPFVFSWASASELGPDQYLCDRENAESSGGAMANFLVCLHDHLMKLHSKNKECSSSAFLVAHSLGAFVLQHAVRNSQEMPCPDIKLFDATLLMAPDVDVDALEKESKLLPLKKLTKEIVVYVNKNDLALSAAGNLLIQSSVLQDGKPRMGQNGPQKNTFAVLAKLGMPLTTVRCHEVDFDYDDGSLHRYYRRSVAVIQDIRWSISLLQNINNVLSGKKRDKNNYRTRVKSNELDIYRLNPPPKILNRPGTEEPPEQVTC